MMHWFSKLFLVDSQFLSKNLQKLLIEIFLNVMILKTIPIKAKNHVMMLEKRKILKTFQMKEKNLHKPLIAIIQNVMMLNISLQVKKKI
jgi:hypothetical protein